MNTDSLVIDGKTLTIDDFVSVARGSRPIDFTSDARRAMKAAKQTVDKIVKEDRAVYGVTTGFGDLSRTRISTNHLELLQENLVRSHAAGTGSPLPTEVVRGTMLLQANKLCKGHSGVETDVVELLLGCLQAGIHPVVPTHGSVGASGDLAPLAHVALVLIGEGEAEVDGVVRPGGEALDAKGLDPLRLGPKEGLAILNGTEVSTAIGSLAVHDARRILDAAIVTGAMSLEALRGSHMPFEEAIHAIRPHAGQRKVAGRLRALLANSQINVSHEDCPRVQDPYSMRCMPQVLGATWDALDYCRGAVETELNSTTDNPLVFSEDDRVLYGGNFHAQPIALAMDFLKIAMAEVANIAERRIYLMLDASRSELPPFLAGDPGLESGLMIAQNTAAGLASENKVLAHPASVDSIPTSGGMEDHASMAPSAARQARQILDNTSRVVAIELLCASQGLAFLEPLRPGQKLCPAVERVRRDVPVFQGDRPISAEIEALRNLVTGGDLTEIMESAT